MAAVGGTAVGFAGDVGGAVGFAGGGVEGGAVCAFVVETVGRDGVKVGCAAAAWYVPPSAFITPLTGADCSIIA